MLVPMHEARKIAHPRTRPPRQPPPSSVTDVASRARLFGFIYLGGQPAVLKGRVGLLTTQKQNEGAKMVQNWLCAQNNPLAPVVLRKQTKTKYANRVLSNHENFVLNSLLGAEPMSRSW